MVNMHKDRRQNGDGEQCSPVFFGGVFRLKKLSEEFIRPITVLSAICLLCAWAVAATFAATQPEILRMEAERAREARLVVLPQADDFIQLEAVLPEGVTEGYRASNGTGFVFLAYARGYGGNVPFMVGIDADGRIAGIEMLSNSETVGFRERVEDPDYLALFFGVYNARQVLGVDSISGVTRTSEALKISLERALEAFEQVRD